MAIFWVRSRTFFVSTTSLLTSELNLQCSYFTLVERHFHSKNN